MRYLTCLFNNDYEKIKKLALVRIYLDPIPKLSINLICSKLYILIAINFTNAKIFNLNISIHKKYTIKLHNIVHNIN